MQPVTRRREQPKAPNPKPQTPKPYHYQLLRPAPPTPYPFLPPHYAPDPYLPPLLTPYSLPLPHLPTPPYVDFEALKCAGSVREPAQPRYGGAGAPEFGFTV